MATQNFLIVFAHIVDCIHFERHCVQIQIFSDVNEVKNMNIQFRKEYFTASCYGLDAFLSCFMHFVCVFEIVIKF